MAYNASAQFHSAVISDSPVEKALIVFGDDFFTGADIDSSSGLTFTDFFNPDEELMIGGTPSNTLNVTIINDLGLLDSLTWNREFAAYLGVETTIDPFSNPYGGKLYAWVSSGVIITVEDTAPYLYCNGTALTDQPSKPVVGLWVYNDVMYAIAEDGTATKYTLSGTVWTLDATYSQSAFMQNSFVAFNGISRSFSDNKLREFTANSNIPETWGDVSTETWCDISARTWGSFGNVQAQVTEYVPLGRFKASRPKVLSSALVEIEAYDRMINLDVIADEWFNSLVFPLTLNEIAQAFCAQYNLTLDNSLYVNPIPNGSMTFSELPTKIENVTAREILSNLAEATGTIAHFTRDGKLRLGWFETNSITIPWIFSQTEFSYPVPLVDGVIIRSTEDENGVQYGDNTNPYVITDNIFYPGTISSETLLTAAQNIYNRLRTMPVFHPSNVVITSDWSIEGGDIVTANGVTTPIYTQTITYNGGTTATLENTGEEMRPVDSAVSRETFTTKTAVATIQADIDGLIAATKNNKLTFDENGLHIYNGGFNIYDGNNIKALYADENGNLNIQGDFVSIAPIASYYDEIEGETYNLWSGVKMNTGQIQLAYAVMPEGMPPTSDLLPTDWYDAFFMGLSYDESQWSSAQSMIERTVGRLWTNSITSNIMYSGQIHSYIFWGNLYNTNLSSGTGTAAVWADMVFEDGTSAKYLVESSSSRRYKKNIKPISIDTSAIIDALKPITYEDKASDSGKQYYGFIAEDVDKVCPMLVQYNADGQPQSLMYDRITVLLADDNKKLRKRIDSLEERIKQLEQIIQK